ncbi:hypothetical protein GCM10010129_75500 [Streptomyces fumigatiscleroticus]|nr:hypothetical protein GCM10010129_75500 [Streptomyces fumigatiscleroticus]
MHNLLWTPAASSTARAHVVRQRRGSETGSEDAREMDVEVFDVDLAAAGAQVAGQEFGESGCPFPD